MKGDAEITYRWAGRLVDCLAAAGMKRIVLSPGSRSTPLALAALRHAGVTADVVVDERSAAFFALGLSKAEGAPVGLVATSGSAVANWWPAVVEADMARVPLVLLSADRPPELHDCGANQTTDQLGLFGGHVRMFRQLPPAESDTEWLAHLAARSVAASLAPLPGPVHLNVPLREPLVPAGDVEPAIGTMPPRRLAATPLANADSIDAVAQALASGPGAIVCGPDDLGDDFRQAVAALARRLRVPLFADLLSGLRFGRLTGDDILAHPDQVARTAPLPAWLLRFGGMPVAKAPAEWLTRCRGRPQIVVSAHPRTADAGGTASHFLHADPAALCNALAAPAAPPAWREEFQRLDRRAAVAAEALCGDGPLFEGALLRGVLRILPEDTGVFLGNSLAVRSAEWFAGRGDSALRFFGNRGVSGIDGNLSTAFGIAAARGRAVAVVGDLAFLHDVNGLALGRHGRLTVLLLDNGGGGIFDHLAQAALPEFEQGWLTPQSLDPAAAAQAFGLGYRCAGNVGDLAAAVRAALDAPASCVVHARIDRGHSLSSIRAFHSSCIQGA